MEYTYIENQEKLDQAIEAWGAPSVISIDLEFDSNRYRYGFNLCLMQIGVGDHAYLIDPVVNPLDLSRVFTLIEDPKVEKLCYAFGEDHRLLHHLGCVPKNLYDVKVAASLLDYPPLSLENILAEVLDIEPGGSKQKSNWNLRPLKEAQLIYAASDIAHLSTLKENLAQHENAVKLNNWIVEENKLYDTLTYSGPVVLPYRSKDRKDLTQFEWHIYKQILELREEVAESFNRPGAFIIDKKFLKELAQDTKLIQEIGRRVKTYRKVDQEDFKKRILDIVLSADNEAESLGLSKTASASPKYSKEEYSIFRAKRTRNEEIRKTVYEPIKEELVKRLGQNAGTYLFSNRVISDVLEEGIDIIPTYKQLILQNLADEIGVKLPI